MGAWVGELTEPNVRGGEGGRCVGLDAVCGIGRG